MSKESRPYRRLSGTGFFTPHRIYAGADHLLSIKATSFSEDYMRFYYKDIQSIILRKTINGKVFNLLLAAFLIIFLLSALGLHGGWAGFFFALTVLFFLLFIINWLRGPTCICHIMTPIQTVLLPALRRIRKAEKALARLRPLIEGAQGVLSEESLHEIRQEEDVSPRVKTYQKALKHEQGNFHVILFALILVSGLFIAIGIFYQNIVISLMSGLVVLSATILLIVSLVKQTGSDLSVSLKTITWFTAGYLFIVYLSGYMVSVYAMVKNPGISSNEWGLIKNISIMSPMDHPWLMRLSIFCLCSALILGLSGLVLTRKFRKEYEWLRNNQSSGHDASRIELDYE
jgi:hypothetical protein